MGDARPKWEQEIRYLKAWERRRFERSLMGASEGRRIPHMATSHLAEDALGTRLLHLASTFFFLSLLFLLFILSFFFFLGSPLVAVSVMASASSAGRRCSLFDTHTL